MGFFVCKQLVPACNELLAKRVQNPKPYLEGERDGDGGENGICQGWFRLTLSSAALVVFCSLVVDSSWGFPAAGLRVAGVFGSEIRGTSKGGGGNTWWWWWSSLRRIHLAQGS